MYIRWENFYLHWLCTQNPRFWAIFGLTSLYKKVVQRRNGMPDFRENGVIRCARLESKKSASGAVKKFRAAEWSRKMSLGGGLIQPPPGRFRVKVSILIFMILFHLLKLLPHRHRFSKEGERSSQEGDVRRREKPWGKHARWEWLLFSVFRVFNND